MADELQIERPDDRITIKVGGENRELFMSFARLNNCLRLLDEPDALPSLMVDPNLGDAILRTMLAPTPTTRLEDVEIGEEDLSMDDYDRVIYWVRDHLEAFFLKRFQKLGAAGKRLEPVTEALVSSLTGSEGSSSSAPSAGPSA